MAKPQILYKSSEIHARIKSIFSKPHKNDRRLALVAYVGKDGDSYLPSPKGLCVICSPTAGATNPDALRRLLQNEAIVKFSDALHMKVYWSRQRGAIITSANASSNALGKSGLKEAGIWLPPGMLNIDKLLKYAKPRNLRATELRKLDVQTRSFAKRFGGPYVTREPVPVFLEWYKSKYPTLWKINWGDEIVVGDSAAAKQETLTEYGRRQPYTWGSVAKGRVKPNEWLLSFFFRKDQVTQLQWKYVDFLVKISSKEKKYYNKNWPYHAVQVHGLAKYPSPPFRITSQFRKAFSRACASYTFEKIRGSRSDRPSEKLLKLIHEEILRPATK
jgi:hypothetical protein